MPFYDYRCDSCGDFREIRPMKESAQAQACPLCGEASERRLSAPFLAGNDSSGQAARPRGDQARVPWRMACGLGCSHSHGA